jgi:hypothetical protein
MAKFSFELSGLKYVVNDAIYQVKKFCAKYGLDCRVEESSGLLTKSCYVVVHGEFEYVEAVERWVEKNMN